MIRWLRIAGIGLGALVLLVLLIAGLLLGTTPGARFVLSRVIPAEVEVGDIDGRLWGPLALEDVRYTGPAMEARVERVRVDWQPTRLLRRALVIDALEVDTADVQMLETEPTANDDGAPFVRPAAPLAIRVERLEGREIRVLTVGGDTVRTARLVAAGGARQDTFDLDSLRLWDFDIRGGRFELDAGGRVVTGASGARDSAGLDLHWQGRLADGREIAGRGTIRGAGGALAIEHRLSSPIIVTLDGRVTNPWMPDSLSWSAALQTPRFALTQLRDGLAGALELSVDATGDLGSARAQIAGRGTYPELGPAAVDTRLAYGNGAITVDTLRLRQLEGVASVTGAGRVELGDAGPSVDARLAWTDLGWPLDTMAIASPGGSLHMTGRAEDFEATADLALRRPDRSLGRWTVRAEGRYESRRIVIPELVARADDGGRLSLTADVSLEDGPRGDATLEWTDLTWPPAPGDSSRLASADGRVEVTGAMEDFTVVADASLSGTAVPLSRFEVDVQGDADRDAVNVRIDAIGRVEGNPAVELTGRGAYRLGAGVVVIDTVDARIPETGGRLALRGTADLSDPEQRLEGHARWQDLGWPVRDPRYRSEQGEVTVTTTDARIVLSGDLRLDGAALPESRWRLAGQGGLDRFAVDSVTGDLLGGRVRVAGVVWPDSGAWDLAVTGDSLDPGEWRPAWNGQVAFRLRSDGRADDDGPTFRVTLDSVAGTLRERSLAGAGAAQGSAGRVAVDTLWLRAGGSTIAASGSVGDSVDVTWWAAAESLYDLVPDAAGALEATGRVTGSRRAPSLSLTAEGDSVTVAGWTAGGLAAAVDVVEGGEDSSSVVLQLTDVQGATVTLDSVSLAAAGTRESHTLSIVARSPDDVLEGRLAGGTTDDRWVGILDRFRLRSAVAGDWQLRDSARVVAGADSGAVERLCWVGSGELCLSASWDSAGVAWDASGQGLPLAFFRPVLPQGVVARGQFGLDTRGRTGGGPVPMGTLDLTAGSGEIDFTPDVGSTVTQPYDTFAAVVESDSAAVDGRIELRLRALGSMTATATLPGDGPLAERSLDGRLSLHLEDDGSVSRYFPFITESQGTADIEVEMAGSLSAPQLQGQVSLADVGANVTPAGIRLTDGQLGARSTGGSRWQLEGGIRSGGSRLEITGSARPPDPDSTWLVDLSIEADSFPTVQTPDLAISTSPRLEMLASPSRVTLNGRLGVPRARIAVRELEGTVQTSPDVVVVGAGAAEDSAVTPAVVRANIQVVLGDSVSIDVRGLTGGLDGQLSIEALPQRPPVASGELQIENGRYRIYRQTFQIDRGRLLYASTPLTNPGLDLRITRQSDSVTVGMNISGRASDPRVQLFSDPSLSDEETLAYLIAGRPLRSLSQSEGSRVQNMAESVGVAGGNLLLARLGNVFGLETARYERVDPGPDDEGERYGRLVLGARVLPRVHVDYAIGLGEAGDVLRLRYMVTDHWILQTERGQATGADLLYTWGGGASGPEVPREPVTPGG